MRLTHLKPPLEVFPAFKIGTLIPCDSVVNQYLREGETGLGPCTPVVPRLACAGNTRGCEERANHARDVLVAARRSTDAAKVPKRFGETQN